MAKFASALSHQCFPLYSSICNMGTHGLLDMFTLSFWASGVYIMQANHAHVTNTKIILTLTQGQQYLKNKNEYRVT